MLVALAAIFTLVWQIFREIRAHQQKNIEIKRQAKIKIVSDLVSLRFILTSPKVDSDRQNAELEFNRTLSRIPIDFIEHKQVLIEYQELGDEFTAEKFHSLIKEMLEAAGHTVPAHFTVKLLETVPSKSK